jgi:hypothetical protein
VREVVMDYNKSEPIQTSIIDSETGAHELINSPDMRPYLRLITRGLADPRNIHTELDQIEKLPLEKRYIWRVASALKWGFADFDDMKVNVDRQTLSPDDLQRVIEILRLRPVQFCMLLTALFGAEQMERLMKHAIRTAREYA